MVKTAALHFLAVLQVAVGTSVTVSTTAVTRTVASPSICPSRSINYITQTLPQQCLTSSWASKPIAQTSTTLASSSHIDALASFIATNVSTSSSHNGSETLRAYTDSASPGLDAGSSQNGHGVTQNTSPESSKQAEPSEESSHESDLDSPLDNANFLSFEEWKHQNLAKAGQSAENLGSREGGGGSEQRRKPGGINTALESLGEDSEIDIDFSGFVNAGGMSDALPIQSALPGGSSTGNVEVAKEDAEDLSSPHRRSKDAGKTCKERSNYTSFDCAATALKANPECKGATSVLVESKDSYMLNVCSAKNKFFIVELCDDILIDTVVLANFEYFSSMFRTFRVSVSDRYPVKMDRWKELGTFEARNSREIQAFLVDNPLIWARYLRIEFLTHYGAEYYCPVSLLRVHGTTMMEEFNHEVKGLRGEDDAEHEAGEHENEAIVQMSEVVSAEVLRTAAETFSKPTEEDVPMTLASIKELVENAHSQPSVSATLPNGPGLYLTTEGLTPYESSIGKGLEDLLFCKTDRVGRCSHVHQPTETKLMPSPSPTMACEPEASTKSSKEFTIEMRDKIASQGVQPLSEHDSMVTNDIQPNPPTPSHPRIAHASTDLSVNASSRASTNLVNSSVGADSTSSATSSVTGSVRADSTSSAISQETASSEANFTSSTTSSIQAPSSSSVSSAGSSSAATTSATTSVKTPSSSTQPPAANPSTQESFFKSVHKRLQQLEANSTLSLQYIEEQSRILRDAFSKVEKRQLSKTSIFLETLNTTVLTELRDFRTQYDQIWQSTVLELSSQREQSAHEVSALSTRMAILADEIVFQKRIAMVQFMLILLCLGLVIFSHYGSASTYLELPPLVQNAIKRSSANLARYTHFETPPGSPSSSRPPSTGTLSRYGLFHRKKHQRNPSDESDMNGRAQSPTIAYLPPSPESQVSREDREASPSGPSGDESEDLSFGPPAPHKDAFRGAKSSPTTPNGMREVHRELLQGPLLTPRPCLAEKGAASPSNQAG